MTAAILILLLVFLSDNGDAWCVCLMKWQAGGSGCGAGNCPTALSVLLFLGCGTSHRGEAKPGLTSERL